MSKISKAIADAIFNSKTGKGYNEVLKGLQEDIDSCKVKVWREDESVKLPAYAKDGDACMDVYVHRIEKKEDGRIVYHTGLHFALPEDYEMEIRPRSSITKTMEFIPNAPGTLDAGFRGELLIVCRNTVTPNEVPEETWYSKVDRVAQILIRRRERIEWNEVETKEELGVTERGESGFGSSGK